MYVFVSNLGYTPTREALMQETLSNPQTLKNLFPIIIFFVIVIHIPLLLLFAENFES